MLVNSQLVRLWPVGILNLIMFIFKCLFLSLFVGSIKTTGLPVIVLPSAVIKRRGPGISPGYTAVYLVLSKELHGRNIEPKEIHSCLIPCLLVVFIRQLEILVTNAGVTLYPYEV